jgi:hypothetical protein
MLYRDPPTADAALLGYLASVIAGVAAFALVVVWLMQPAVIPNGGLAAFEQERRPTAWLALRSPDIDPDESAVALASKENEKQGLRSVADGNQVAPPTASPKATASVTPSKVAAAAPRPKAKPVAKVQRRDYAADARNAPRNAWAYAPDGARGPFGGGFGGFGSWFR